MAVLMWLGLGVLGFGAGWATTHSQDGRLGGWWASSGPAAPTAMRGCSSRPALVVAFSTGHVGTTTLSGLGQYRPGRPSAEAACKPSDYRFFFEQGGKQGLLEGKLLAKFHSLQRWHDAGGRIASRQDNASLTARQAKLVLNAYLPTWGADSGSDSHAAVWGHDALLYYKGILALTDKLPHDRLLFVRVRRSSDEFATSWLTWGYEKHYFYLTPFSPGTVTRVSNETWTGFTGYRKALWYHDEVEARWRELKREHPDVPTLEVYWSKHVEGSFEAACGAVANAMGLTLGKLRNSKVHVKTTVAPSEMSKQSLYARVHVHRNPDSRS